MGKNIKKYISEYLDKNFFVRDTLVYRRFFEECIHSHQSLIYEIMGVFGYECFDGILEIVKPWADYRGVDWERWTLPKQLKATWSPELAQDLTAFHNIDAEAELTALLTEEISKEINASILGTITNLDQLVNRLGDLGYHKSPVIYNPENFAPIQRFVRR